MYRCFKFLQRGIVKIRKLKNMEIFIPAKTYSRRVEKKNIRKFAGSSLLELTINFFSKYLPNSSITLSSDSKRILEIFSTRVQNLHFRNDEVSNPNLTNFEVMQDWILKNNISQTILLAQPCHPFRYKEDLEIIKSINSPKNYVSIMKSDQLFLNDKEKTFQKKFNAKHFYFVDGTYYLINPQILSQTTDLVFETFLIDNQKPRINIDTIYDFDMAEILYKKYYKK